MADGELTRGTTADTLAADALRPRVARRFPLDEIADAQELLGTGGMGGGADRARLTLLHLSFTPQKTL